MCSKCKGICNENSENVSKKRRNSESNNTVSTNTTTLNTKRSINAPITRSLNILNNKGTVKSKEPTLVSRLTRLELLDESLGETLFVNLNNNTYSEGLVSGNKPKPENNSKKPLGNTQNENSQESEKKNPSNPSSDSCSVDDVDGSSVKKKKLLRKRRADSCLDDQWVETDNQENPNR